MIIVSVAGDVETPDWPGETPAPAEPAPEAPAQADIAYASAPGRDDRTPLEFIDLVFQRGDPTLPGKLSGIGPVFWPAGGRGSGALIARDVVLTTVHLFVKGGTWHGGNGLLPVPPDPIQGSIFLAACGRSYAFTDLPCYATHTLMMRKELRSDGLQAQHVFGVFCTFAGVISAGSHPNGTTGLIETKGCDGVPGGSGGPLLLSRDAGATYEIVGVANSYRPNTEFNNYTRIEGVFAAHLARFLPGFASNRNGVKADVHSDANRENLGNVRPAIAHRKIGARPMTRALASRLAKLEALRKRPTRVRNHVVTVDPEGRVIGAMTKRRPVMIVVDHGTDEQWEAKLLKQQARLIAQHDEKPMQ